MAFIQTISEEQAAGLLQDQYQAARKSTGYVPNYIQAFSLCPEVYDAWGKLITAIRSRMRLRRYELVTLATAMALADGGELIVLAPAQKEFGEDKEIDRLIRKYGYRGTPYTLRMTTENEELRNNLGAAAHLIHGSSEGRFSVTYCPGKNPENLSREEIESVGFLWADYDKMMASYHPERLKDGYNKLPNGEAIFFISNPALGLWAYRERFQF